MEKGRHGQSADSGNPHPKRTGNPKPGDRDKYWKLAAESTSVAILAEETLVAPKKPGLDRQPKTLNALGIGGIMRRKEKEQRENNKSVKNLQLASGSDLGDDSRQKIGGSDSFRRMTRRKSSAKSRSSMAGSNKGSSKGRSRGSIIQRHSSTDISVSEGSRGTDDEDKWELFPSQGQGYDGDLLTEREPAFEMAVVEIDVNDAQEEMHKILKKMLNQGRTTLREKTVLADTFGMFLQALVHMQEGEVEAIDHLQTKNGILQTITYFIRAAEELGTQLVEKSEEKIESDEGLGILDSLKGAVVDDSPKEADDEGSQMKGGTKPAKTIQGISVDEMNTSTLRETFLGQRNKLDMQTHLKNIHALELKQVQFEKTLMELHYSKMVKPGDLQREMRDLRKSVTDLQLELSVIQQDTTSVRQDIQAQEKALHDDEIATDKLDLEMLTKQMEVQQNANKPLHLAKEADKEAHKLEQVLDQLNALNDRWVDGMESIRHIQAQVDHRIFELQNLAREEGKMYNSRRNSVHDAESLSADMEIMLKKEQNLLDKCAAAAEGIVLAGRTRKRLQEEIHHVHNNTNRSLREYQKFYRQANSSQEAVTNSKLAYEKMRSAFEASRPRDDSNNWEKLGKMFEREIANLKNALSSKIQEATYNSNQVEKLQRHLSEMYDEQIECGKELQDLIRTTVRKRRERQEKSEQCIKLEAQVYRLVQDKKMQHLVLGDCARSERDLHKMMEALRITYTQMKIERASLMNDLIQARQKLSEQSEKVKICSNEIDSYSNQLLDRTREIQRAHYVNLNAGLARDSVRNEALRSIVVYRTHRKERDEVALTNKTLRKEIQAQQNEVAAIRQMFEESIHESNRIAVCLRERMEEVCTFIEKIKAYETIVLKGNLELTVRELERAKLVAIFEEIKKHLVIVTTNQPDESKLVAEITLKRDRVYEITQERMDLEGTLNNVKADSRRRDVRHDLITKRETPELLNARLSNLEKSLATRDCLSLERDLILKQVEDFTEDAVVKANYLKEHYANEVRVLVGLRKGLYHTSNRIDGMICEASLANAKAETAEHRYNKLKERVDEADERFKNGHSPSDEMEKEFAHILWREEMLRRSNNQPKGFFVKRNPLSGSKIIIERGRPKTKILATIHHRTGTTIPQISFPIPVKCKRRPYRPIKFRPLTANRAHIRRNKTGLPMCNRMTF